MSKKQYIALQAIQFVDDNGVRQSIEPRSEKHSGLFEHAFDRKQEKRLLALGAIREPEGTEEHEDPTPVEALHDSRDIEGTATEVKKPLSDAQVKALDGDENGAAGGSKPGRKKAEAEPKAEPDAPAADAKNEDLLG
jgi:hypothetical protein